MTDLICRKSMTRCLTPGMCSPHGGCQTPETASAFRSLLAERNSLAFLLKRFVDGEHDQEESQSERHLYHDEAETLLAYLGGEVQGHTLVPDEILRAEHEKKKALIAENDALTAKTETYCTYGGEGSEHTYYGNQAAIAALTQLVIEVEALRKDADRYRWIRDKSEAVHQFYLSAPLWFTGVRFRAQDVDEAIDAMSKGE